MHEIAEAAKYRDQNRATYSLIVAPMISEYETEIVSEIKRMRALTERLMSSRRNS